MTRKHKKRDYEIGYGKPPRHTRFKPGQSGNSKGRPKDKRNGRTIMRELLQQPVRIRENGKQRTVTSQEALFMRLIQNAMNGSTRDQIQALKLMQTYLPEVFENEDLMKAFRIEFVQAKDGRPVQIPEEDKEVLTQEQWLARAEAEKAAGKDRADAEDAGTAESAEADEDDDMSFLD